MYAGRALHTAPLLSHSEYADGQTDRRTGVRALRYAFR